MIEKAAKQFDEICQIKDRYERAKTACDLFTAGKLSAKALRMLAQLDSFYLRYIFETIYSSDVRKKNMERLPPSVMVPEAVVIKNEHDYLFWSHVKGLCLIEQYYQSKEKKPKERLVQLCRNSMEDKPFVAVFQRPFNDFSKASAEFAISELVSERSHTEHDISSLDLPSIMTIGVELEGIGASKSDIIALRSVVPGLEQFRVKTDGSIYDSMHHEDGCEVVSGVLEDEGAYWSELAKACDVLKLAGFRANHTCGGHIHIGSNILGADKEAWKTFFVVWKEVEPLMYMICNRKGERSRNGVVTYAKMATSHMERVNWENVSIKSEVDVAKVLGLMRDVSMYSSFDEGVENLPSYDRYYSVNLTNLGNDRKNTIEFRLPNGTIDYDILRENILLFGRLLQACKTHSMMPTYKREQYEALFEKDLPEKEKLIRFLDYIFDKEEEKQIFFERWRSRAGEEPLFGESSIKTYKHQKEPEKILKEMEKIAETVPDEKRIEAMQELIGGQTQSRNDGFIEV